MQAFAVSQEMFICSPRTRVMHSVALNKSFINKLLIYLLEEIIWFLLLTYSDR